MFDGRRGPSHADIARLQRQMEEESIGFREKRMLDLERKLLRTVYQLGPLSPATQDYHRVRRLIRRAVAEYRAARAAWVDAVADQKAFGFRMDVSRKLEQSFKDILAAPPDSPHVRCARLIRQAIDSLR
jgi:hypothetical protein